MHSFTPAELAEQIVVDHREMATLLARRRLEPILGLELTLHQLRIVLLVASGAATTGRELAEALHVSPPAVSSSVDKLVELGFIVRDSTDPDRRVKHLAPSEKSQALVDQFLGLRDATDEYLVGLEPDELEALARGTRALRRAMEDGAG